MARILFSTLGSLGDLHPYLAIARALQERGHSAVIATMGEHQHPVERAGVDFLATSPAVSDEGDYREIAARLLLQPDGDKYLVRDLVMAGVRPAYDVIMEAARDVDLLVSHTFGIAAPIVAEKRQLPWVSTVLTPMLFMSVYDPPIIPKVPWLHRLRWLGPWAHRFAFAQARKQVLPWEAPLHDLRRELGVSPLPGPALFEGQFSPQLNLALFDEILGAHQPDWPESSEITGNPVFDGEADPAMMDELQAFLDEGEPPIVFALGSSAVLVAGAFWEHAVEAAKRLGRRAILVTGSTDVGNLPPGIRTFPYLPYSEVFPRAAAVVHQAGIGTLARALRSGRPQVIVPLAFDQPDNAYRTAKLGAARVIPLREVTAAKLTRALQDVMSEPAYQSTASRIAADLASVDGAGCAAEKLIGMLR